jgi:hypothetical protein
MMSVIVLELLFPLIFSWSMSTLVLAETSGERATTLLAPAGIGCIVSERTTRSAPTTCATVLSNEALMPFANTATKTTRPSPTMSAAAVVAVRPGLRIAFSRASRPGSANRRSSGQPMAPARGRTNQRALRATPTNSSTTPPAIIDSRLAAGPAANKPATSIATPSTATMAATNGAQRRREPCSSCPCSAAIGGTSTPSSCATARPARPRCARPHRPSCAHSISRSDRWVRRRRRRRASLRAAGSLPLSALCRPPRPRLPERRGRWCAHPRRDSGPVHPQQ